MLRTNLIVAICLLACLAAGCSTVPTEERSAACATRDWQRFGENDGRLGVPVSDRRDDFQECERLGYPPDRDAYGAGWVTGLSHYCTAENGFRVGIDGRKYENVCPPEWEFEFLQGLRRGRAERPKIAGSPNVGVGLALGTNWLNAGLSLGIGIFQIFLGQRHYRYDHRSQRYDW